MLNPMSLKTVGWFVFSLCVLWVIMQVGLYMHVGFLDGGDSVRYYRAAEIIFSGSWPGGKAASYLGYNLFVTPFLALGLDRITIGLSQVLLTALAALCLYKIGERVFSQRVGFTATLLYVAYPDIHYWNFIIYSESLYTSMMIVSLFLLLTRESRLQLAIAIGVMAFTCTIRPHGVGFALAIIAYFVYRLWEARKTTVLAVLALALALALPVAWVAVGKMAGYEMVGYYTDGTVVWHYDELSLAVPSEVPVAVAKVDHPIAKILALAVASPNYFLQLVGAKLFYFFLHIRPYFSTGHNAISLLFLVPAYTFALWGLFRSPARQSSDKVVLVAIVVFQTLIVSLTYADWDGRFLIPILPPVFLLAASGFWSMFDIGLSRLTGKATPPRPNSRMRCADGGNLKRR